MNYRLAVLLLLLLLMLLFLLMTNLPLSLFASFCECVCVPFWLSLGNTTESREPNMKIFVKWI